MKEYEYNDENRSDSVSEPLSKWGGQWTEEKLDTFAKYVNAYLKIMNSHRDKYNWTLIYFDGFAGSGSRYGETNSVSELLLDMFDDDVIRCDEINLYQGAAERILSIEQKGFDYYYFIDKSQESINKLRNKIEKYCSSDRTLEFRCSDANEEVVKMSKALKANPKLRAMVLLDPFGMQVSWDTIASLANTHTDLWILIPTGVIVNRLLDRKGELRHIETLSSFFGLSEEDIKGFFYKKQVVNTLFGEEEIVTKVSQPIKRIAELYIERLRTIFDYVTEEPLIMYNTRHTPIFHFAFASNNETAKKIAKDIIKKKGL